MDGETLANVVQYLIATRRAEEVRYSEIHEWVKDRVCSIYVPKKASAEYRQLVDQSRWNVLDFLIGNLAKNFYVDGYRPARSGENAEVWKVWQANRMDARQSGLWRKSLEYGVSYTTTLPGTIGDEEMPVMTPWSPRRLTALYEDPINDEWARYAMTVGFEKPVIDSSGVQMVTPVTVYDEWYEYKLDVPSTMMRTQAYTFGRPVPMYLGEIVVNADNAVASEHGIPGYTPVVRYMDTFGELDDGPEGIVWPIIPAQRQLNQTTFSLGMAEFFSAFIQKYVTGLEIQEDENGNPKEPFNVAVDKLLQAEDPDTKFGSFPQTDLAGYLTSRDKTLLYISAVRQIAPHTMVVGEAVSNVSAEALAALEAGHGQDIAEHKASYGESIEQNMRLAGLAMGDKQAWRDTSAQVRWRDTTPRSLAQVADALGKLATMLEVPPEELWERIPDVTDQDLERWKKAHKQRDSMAKLDGMLNDARSRRQPANTGAPGNPVGDS
jgi:SPP1 Gp6-like portal protein